MTPPRPAVRRRLLWLVALAAGLLLPLVPDGILVSRASADSITVDPLQLCSQTQHMCPAFPSPPPLVSEAALAGLPSSEADAVRAMEDQAVRSTIADHGLSANDGDAVESWARSDAQAELWIMVRSAIATAADKRTATQQGVVDWMAGLVQAQKSALTEYAGAQYAQWAGLDVHHYWDIAGSATESGLTSFLSSGVNPHSPTHPHDATAGYCGYQPPSPDSDAYDGSSDPTCFGPCPSVLGCDPPTPSYDQFLTWGEDAAAESSLGSTALQVQAVAIAGATAMLDGAVGAGITAILTYAASNTSSLVPGLEAFAAVTQPYYGSTAAAAVDEVAETAAEGATEAGEFLGELEVVGDAAAAVSGIAAIVGAFIFALVTAVTEGIKVFDALALPAKLAAYVVGARTQVTDPATMLDTTADETVLFDLFAGATLPVPRTDATCERDYILSGKATGVAPGVSQYYALGLPPDQLVPNAIVPSVPCLNRPAVPDASPTDPHFLVAQRSTTSGTAASTLTVRDVAAHLLSTVRVANGWFVQQVGQGANATTVQTLRLHYTDWNGKEQQAELLPTGNGYRFLVVAAASGTIDPSTCLADGTCAQTTSIRYQDGFGDDYQAAVVPYAPPTGAPRYVQQVEGSSMRFVAGGYTPGKAVGTVTYRWEFEQQPCSVATLCVQPSFAHFGTPVAGDSADHIWPGPGTGLVRLTATDAVGNTAVDVFPVHIGNVPPTMQLSSDCATTSQHCDVRAATVGKQVTVSGVALDAGTNDFENVKVVWDDGTSDTQAAGNGVVTFPDLHLTFTQGAADTSKFIFTASHAYSAPGVYTGHVTVSDFEGGTVNQAFTATVSGPQQISFSALGDQTYGDQVALAATGGPSGKPVTFTASPAAVCTTSGDSGATLTMVGVGACTVTAHQAAAPPVFMAASAVQHTFTVDPAPLQIKPDDAKATYGAATPTFTASVTGLANGDTEDAITGLTVTGPPVGSHVGTYDLVASSDANPDYDITYVPGTLTVDRAPLTVTADDTSRAYGAKDPAFTASLDGLVNGDTAADLTGLTFSTDQRSSDRVGTYSVTPAGLTDPDYRVSYVPGTLTVKPARLTITADDQTTTYGGTDPTFTATYGGLVNGDTKADINGLTVTGAPTGSNAGTYPIVPSGATSPNYDISYANGTETIEPAPLTIRADDQTKTYGGSDPSLTATFTGLVNGDQPSDITGLVVTGPPTTSHVGSYAIHAHGAGSGNYDITFADGTEKITPASLTITADPKTTASGQVPTDTWFGVGWVNGDTDATLTKSGNHQPSCTAVVTATPGAYPGAITCQGAKDGDYAIGYQAATLTVDPVLDLDQTGLPRGAAGRVTVDGAGHALPLRQLEVGYGTPHSYSFPGVLVASNGTIYTTAAPAFTGVVTANVTQSAAYDTEEHLIKVARASGGIRANRTAKALTRSWAKVERDLTRHHASAALGDLRAFARDVAARKGTLTAATATLLVDRAQIAYASLGGQGGVDRHGHRHRR